MTKCIQRSVYVVANVLSEWLGSLETPILPESVKEGLEDSPRMCYLLIDTILAMVGMERAMLMCRFLRKIEQYLSM